MTTHDEIADLLAFDPLDAAEKMTGESYKENDGVAALGMLMAMSHGEAKAAALIDRDDTTFSNALGRYLRIAADEGFRVVLVDPFDTEHGHESYYMLWHDDDGILLEFDTFRGDNVNSGKFLYNFRMPADPDARSAAWRALSSHGPIAGHDDVRTGDHDCREALRFNLARLRASVEFVSPWLAIPFGARYPLNYMEWKADDETRAKVAADRLSRLPEDVRKAMGVPA